MGVVALDLEVTGAAAEHAVEFIGKHGDGLVALVGGNGGVHVGTVDGNVALGGEAVGDVLAGIALELDAYSNDALFVAEQSVGFFLHKGFERRGEVEVDARDDQILRFIVITHTFSFFQVG